jgi:hypothetical protein
MCAVIKEVIDLLCHPRDDVWFILAQAFNTCLLDLACTMDASCGRVSRLVHSISAGILQLLLTGFRQDLPTASCDHMKQKGLSAVVQILIHSSYQPVSSALQVAASSIPDDILSIISDYSAVGSSISTQLKALRDHQIQGHSKLLTRPSRSLAPCNHMQVSSLACHKHIDPHLPCPSATKTGRGTSL